MLYSKLEDMLSSAELDIVDIITAPDTHPELVGLAARAGKHILCQSLLPAPWRKPVRWWKQPVLRASG